MPVTLQKHPDSIIRPTGSMTFWRDIVKTVEVDGETYSKNERVEVTETVDEMRDKTPSLFRVEDYGIDGVCDLKAEDYIGFLYGTMIGSASRFHYSDNKCIQNYQVLFEYGFYPAYVVNIFKTKRDYKPAITKDVPICITEYGFNNFLYAAITFRKFLSIENKEAILNYPELHTAFETTYGVDISKPVGINTLITIFNQKINHATRKQQVATALYL